MHFVEAQLRRLPDQFLETLGVLHTRHLYENAIGALPRNVGLAGAEFIDAAAHRFDRAGNRLGNLLLDAGIIELDPDDPVIDLLDIEITLVGSGKDVGGQWLGQLTQADEGTIHIAWLTEPGLNAIGNDAGANRPDLGVAQSLAHVCPEIVEHVLAQLFDVHGVEQMRPAAQIETKRQLVLGQPVRPRLDERRREEVRRCKDDRGDTEPRDRDDFPTGEMEHLRFVFRCPVASAAGFNRCG